MGFGVWGFGFGVWGLGFGVWGLGFGVQGLGRFFFFGGERVPIFTDNGVAGFRCIVVLGEGGGW